jgi:hypothetical protein
MNLGASQILVDTPGGGEGVNNVFRGLFLAFKTVFIRLSKAKSLTETERLGFKRYFLINSFKNSKQIGLKNGV